MYLLCVVHNARECFSAESAKDEGFDVWEQQFARILPECGCAADNVATAAATSCVDLRKAHVQCTPLLRSTTTSRKNASLITGYGASPGDDAGAGGSGFVHMLDTTKNPSGETNHVIAGSAPFVECRTLFYGPDDGSGAWPAGSESLIVDRASSSSSVPATRKRVSVEVKFDAKFAQVSALTELNERSKMKGGIAARSNLVFLLNLLTRAGLKFMIF